MSRRRKILSASKRLWRSVWCFGAALVAFAPALGNADSGIGGWSGARSGWSGGYDPAWYANQGRFDRGGYDHWRGQDWNLGRYGDWSDRRGSDWDSRWDRRGWDGDSRFDGRDWRSDRDGDGPRWRGRYERGADGGWWRDRDRFDDGDQSVMRPPRVIRVDPNRPIYVRPNSRVIIIEPRR